jgi:hypothetical protein
MVDRLTVRMVVVILGLVALASLGLMGTLALRGQDVPDPLISVGSAAVSAVATLLVRITDDTR